MYSIGGAGAPALVFVHGWSCDRSYWREQVPAFSGDHLVVTIDLAGHGESGSGRVSWTMPAFGDDVVAVIEALDLDRVVLIGHSMGGDVIVEAALRLRDRVAGVVWVDTYRSLGLPSDEAEDAAFVASFDDDFPAAVRSLVRDDLFRPTADPELVEWVASDMAAEPAEIGRDAMRHSLANEGPMIAALPRLRTPVVAINPDDPPSDVESLARLGVRTMATTGLGHFPMLEDPAQFNRLLREVLAGLGRPVC